MGKIAKNANHILLLELKKLGLTEKEASLYLLILEKNEATASQIASISHISRPTTYRILGELEQKNLVNKIKKDKKTLFIATSPNTLLGLLKIKKKEAEEQEREFMRIISTLQTTFALKNSGNITELNSANKLDIFLDDLSNTPTTEIFAFCGDSENPTRRILHNTYAKIHERFPDLTVREMYSKSKQTSLANANFIKTKKLQTAQENFSIIVADKVFIITEDTIFILNHKETVIVIKSLLKILWNNI